MKSAFVTGVSGQDGAYLSALLLEKQYRVFGGYRRVSSTNFWRLQELGVDSHPNFELVEHDLTDLGSNIRAIQTAEPDEIYNLAGQSFVAVSFKEPDLTAQISAIGALRLLEAARIVNRHIRLYQASSAEMFGKVQTVPQSEATPFYPRSPYGISKLFAHWSAINYRESYDMFACTGILFNHESPMRGPEFVTRKISQAVARIKLGRQNVLSLGNLDAFRDWGYAAEYVEGMWRMLQANEATDYVLATGITTTVRSFVEAAFAGAEIDLDWQGSGLDEVGRCRASGRILVRIDPKFLRPAEVDTLVGDSSKARRSLGWCPRMTIAELCAEMVVADLQREEASRNRIRIVPRLNCSASQLGAWQVNITDPAPAGVEDVTNPAPAG